MAFLSPIWLLGLLPWGGLVLYMMWGRRKRRLVPFAKLWQHLPHGPRVERRIVVPPVYVVLALVGLLLAVLGAAGPLMRTKGPGQTVVTVIVDRGLSMSARGTAGPRFRELTADVREELNVRMGPTTPVQILFAPPVAGSPLGVRSDVSGLVGRVDQVGVTAFDTGDSVRQLVREASAESSGPVIVISDVERLSETAKGEAGSVVPVAPARALSNVSVSLLSARAAPRPQVMVRVRNGSSIAKAVLRVTTPGSPPQTLAERAIDLPPAGREADYFFDVPALGMALSAQVVVGDDQPLDNVAFLVRESAWPTIESATAVGELKRLVDLYPKLRPAGEGSRRVRIVNADQPLPAESAPAVIIPAAGAAVMSTVRPTRVAAHPITDAVRDWTSRDLPTSSQSQSPAGFEPILWAGDRPLVAVSSSPARQVWSALDVNGWSVTPQYVSFWTAVFDWAGQGGDAYAAHDLTVWDSDWRPIGPSSGALGGASDPSALMPGFYVRSDGATRAFDAPALKLPMAVMDKATWQARLATAISPGARSRGAFGWNPVGQWLILGGLGSLAGAAGTWRRGARASFPRANAYGVPVSGSA